MQYDDDVDDVDDDDDADDDDDVTDEFSVGTISSAEYLGTAESITVASNKMTKKVAKYVAEMVSFNAESEGESSD